MSFELVPAGLADDQILSFAEMAALAGVSVATFKRLGDAGPKLTRISARRCGATVRNFRAWLASRQVTN